MKKLLTILLAIIMTVSLAGCSSGGSKAASNQAGAPAQPVQESKANDTPAPSSKPAGSKRESVPLVEDFPKDAPLPDGVVWACKRLDVKDRKGNPTGHYLYRVNIDTTMSSVTEVYDFYKELITELTNEGDIDTKADTHMASIDGYIGDLHVSVVTTQTGLEDPVSATIFFRSRESMDID